MDEMPADAISRWGPYYADYSLSHVVTCLVLSHFKAVCRPKGDLFVTYLKSKCPEYVGQYPSPFCKMTDALWCDLRSVRWAYAHPPLGLILLFFYAHCYFRGARGGLQSVVAPTAAAARSVLPPPACGEAQGSVVQLLRSGNAPPKRDLICVHVSGRLYNPVAILHQPLTPIWAVPSGQSVGTMLLFNGQ